VPDAATPVSSRSRADDVRSGPLHSADQLVEARIAAFDARSTEALAVLNNRVPQAESAWQASMASARAALAAAGRPAIRADVARVNALLEDYQKVHANLLRQARRTVAGTDDRRRQARFLTAQVAASDTEDGSVGSFEDFDASSGALLARQERQADEGWAASGAHLGLLGWLTLAGGLLAAAAGWRGIDDRLREYR
jgi:hypothetical protein